MKVLWLLPCLALTLTAADISGKWAGTIEVEDSSSGSTINTEVKADFQQHGDAISGTIGRREDEEIESIKNAKLAEGKRFTFEVATQYTSGPMKFVLTLDGSHLDGTMQGEMEDGVINGKVHLSKAP